MSSRRYYITALPVARINGKMAPVATKCPNTFEEVENSGFWYGYLHHADKSINRYAIRTQSRNLNNNPYTEDELANRDLFTQSINAVNTNLQNPLRYALCNADFKKQSEYATLRGFAIARTRANDGIWPRKWRRL